MPAPSAGVRQRTSGALPPVLEWFQRNHPNALWASSERPVASNMPGLRAVRHEGLAARHPSVAPRHVPSSQCQKINAHRSQGPAARPFRDEPKFTPHPPPAQCCAQQGIGGARRDRTDDLMLAKHALYQLSYGPLRKPLARSCHRPVRPRIHGKRWWAQADSNCRPHAYQACALTN